MPVYDAFISYSHAKDKPIATALQSVIQKLGKSWVPPASAAGISRRHQPLRYTGPLANDPAVTRAEPWISALFGGSER